MTTTSLASQLSSRVPAFERERCKSLGSTVVRGSVEFIPLFDVIQWVCGSRRSWSIRLHEQNVDASVTIVEGDLADARWDTKVGHEALLEILKVKRGYFQLEPILGSPERTFEGSSTLALISAAQAADDRCRSTESVTRPAHGSGMRDPDETLREPIPGRAMCPAAMRDAVDDKDDIPP